MLSDRTSPEVIERNHLLGMLRYDCLIPISSLAMSARIKEKDVGHLLLRAELSRRP